MIKNKEGFTLIEMLVVIGIIGLLASVIVVGLGPARERARDSKRISDINQIQNALEIDHNQSTGYADDLPDLASRIANVPQTDPQGDSYIYEVTETTGAGGSFNAQYAVGVCLEGADFEQNVGCPSTLDCGTGPSYCVGSN